VTGDFVPSKFAVFQSIDALDWSDQLVRPVDFWSEH